MKKETVFWALDLSIDLKGCKEEIYNERSLKDLAQHITSKIDTKGSEILGVVNTGFGKHEDNMRGFRLIHESQNTLITGHFVVQGARAYINITSCLPYSVHEVINLICEATEAESCKFKKIFRE